jgi:hypothetical protein
MRPASDGFDASEPVKIVIRNNSLLCWVSVDEKLLPDEGAYARYLRSSTGLAAGVALSCRSSEPGEGPKFGSWHVPGGSEPELWHCAVLLVLSKPSGSGLVSQPFYVSGVLSSASSCNRKQASLYNISRIRYG